MTGRIMIYDTTFGESDQWAKGAVPPEQIVYLARQLDALGVAYIELGAAGNGGEYFDALRGLSFKHARAVVVGKTSPVGINPEEDKSLQTLLAAGTPACALLAVASPADFDEDWHGSPAENLQQIERSIGFVKAAGRDVILEADHFFDGYKVDPQYALAIIQAAGRAGADTVVLCDNQGSSLPWEVGKIVHTVHHALPGLTLGIHTHNAGESALANTVAAVGQGAALIMGAINGYGDRSGNANLCNIIPDLELKMGYTCLLGGQLPQLLDIAHSLAEVVSGSMNEFMPYIGKSSLAPI
jgi:2-isopropylmalate synthase